MKVSVWKQMAVSALLVVCYPLVWLYFRTKDERQDEQWRWYR